MRSEHEKHITFTLGCWVPVSWSSSSHRRLICCISSHTPSMQYFLIIYNTAYIILFYFILVNSCIYSIYFLKLLGVSICLSYCFFYLACYKCYCTVPMSYVINICTEQSCLNSCVFMSLSNKLLLYRDKIHCQVMWSKHTSCDLLYTGQTPKTWAPLLPTKHRLFFFKKPHLTSSLLHMLSLNMWFPTLSWFDIMCHSYVISSWLSPPPPPWKNPKTPQCMSPLISFCPAVINIANNMTYFYTIRSDTCTYWAMSTLFITTVYASLIPSWSLEES